MNTLSKGDWGSVTADPYDILYRRRGMAVAELVTGYAFLSLQYYHSGSPFSAALGAAHAATGLFLLLG